MTNYTLQMKKWKWVSFWVPIFYKILGKCIDIGSLTKFSGFQIQNPVMF